MKNSDTMNEKSLVDKEYLLEKLPGKYGWTFTKNFCCVCRTMPKHCSFSIRLTKVNNTITSSGYIQQRQRKRK